MEFFNLGNFIDGFLGTTLTKQNKHNKVNVALMPIKNLVYTTPESKRKVLNDYAKALCMACKIANYDCKNPGCKTLLDAFRETLKPDERNHIVSVILSVHNFYEPLKFVEAEFGFDADAAAVKKMMRESGQIQQGEFEMNFIDVIKLLKLLVLHGSLNVFDLFSKSSEICNCGDYFCRQDTPLIERITCCEGGSTASVRSMNDFLYNDVLMLDDFVTECLNRTGQNVIFYVRDNDCKNSKFSKVSLLHKLMQYPMKPCSLRAMLRYMNTNLTVECASYWNYHVGAYKCLNDNKTSCVPSGKAINKSNAVLSDKPEPLRHPDKPEPLRHPDKPEPLRHPDKRSSASGQAGTPSASGQAGTPSASGQAGTPSASGQAGTPSASGQAGTPSASGS